MFLKEISYGYQGYIYLIKIKVKSEIQWNIITIKSDCFPLKNINSGVNIYIFSALHKYWNSKDNFFLC